MANANEVSWAEAKDAIFARIAEKFEARLEKFQKEDPEGWPKKMTPEEWAQTLDGYLSDFSFLDD